MRSARFFRYAPKSGKFVLVAHDPNLPKGRRLVLTQPLAGSDGGNAGDYTVSVDGATSSARGVIKLAGQLGGTADLPEVVGVRALGADPASPASGNVWVLGTDLKFRNAAGPSATEVVERQARRNLPGGYAGLDGTGRVASAQAPPKSVYATAGDQALSPADIGAVAPGRSIATGQGLAGGGDLSTNRTLTIAAFTGFVSRDFDPTQASWAANETKVHVTYDIGANGMLVPTALRLPATGDAALATEVAFEFHDGTTKVITNSNAAVALDDSMQGLANALMGGVDGPDQNNGRAVRKVVFRTRNTTANAVNNVDVGVFRIRAYSFPRGAGGAL
jgi:hypothetical protein